MSDDVDDPEAARLRMREALMKLGPYMQIAIESIAHTRVAFTVIVCPCRPADEQPAGLARWHVIGNVQDPESLRDIATQLNVMADKFESGELTPERVVQ